jgi:hypothetical protein
MSNVEITPESLRAHAEFLVSKEYSVNAIALEVLADRLEQQEAAIAAEKAEMAAEEARLRAQEGCDNRLGKRIAPHLPDAWSFVDLGRAAREALEAAGWVHSDDVKFLLTHENVADIRTILATVNSPSAYSLDLLHESIDAARRLKELFGMKCRGCIRDTCADCACKMAGPWQRFEDVPLSTVVIGSDGIQYARYRHLNPAECEPFNRAAPFTRAEQC